ncbi:MAG TPA: DUF342 domain-containing protein, partial [Geobacteraceae bacterium]|nr:DUF342 domain-containing protein [Geobacteraceae bacterium]
MSDGNGTGAGLVFQARDDMKKLVAVFEPVDVMKPIDAHWLRRKLEDEGYADLFIIPDSLGLAVEKYNAATAFALTVAERRDGTFSLVVDEDLMTVRMTVTP